MEQIYRILTEAGSHEYDILVEDIDKGKKFTLLYSNNKVWTYPETEILSLEDNDDGTVKLPKLNRKVELHVACDLGILLRFMQKYSANNKFNRDINFIALESNVGYTI